MLYVGSSQIFSEPDCTADTGMMCMRYVIELKTALSDHLNMDGCKCHYRHYCKKKVRKGNGIRHTSSSSVNLTMENGCHLRCTYLLLIKKIAS